MNTLRRPSRQVYRVYSEEEFLAAEDWCDEPEPVGVDFATSSGPWGRLAGVAALSVTFAALLSVVAIDVIRSSPHSGKRIALPTAAGNRPPKRRVPKVLPSAPRTLPSVFLARGMRRRTPAPRIAQISPRKARYEELPTVPPPPRPSSGIEMAATAAPTPPTGSPAASATVIAATTVTPATAVSPAKTVSPATTVPRKAPPETRATDVSAATGATAATAAARPEFGFER
ncbi:MAG TPA: hypothetical protein VNY52_04900 [Solirubrobacteraceae bacterium]|jgi:hypothetical protein|nr:hypothetical protein [Solirubrobacteraceae bacterium]